MIEDKDAFTRQRRTLNIISIALIVYFVAGGEFDNDIGISTIGISLTNKPVAFALIWLAFFYFWFRFRRFGTYQRDVWHTERLWALSRSKWFINTVKLLSSEKSENIPDVLRGWIRREVVLNRRYKFTSDISDWMELRGRQPPIIRKDILNAGHLKRVPLWKYVLPATYAYFVAMFRFTGWSTYVLPKLLAWLAVASAVYSVVWNHICSTIWINQCTW